MGGKRTRKRASTSTDSDKSPKSESEAKRRSSSSTRSKSRLGPLDGTAAFDQGIGDDINALTGRPEGFDAMVEANLPEFEPLPTGPDAHIQRALEGTDTTQDEVPGTVLDVLGQGGKPLDGPIQRALEDRMDADFSNVRIHTGGRAAEAADAIDAKAFTCGNDIVFNSGEYDTESPEGQHLLAHELAHVKQQNGGASISMMPKEGADLEIDPDPQLEREADQAAEQALSGEGPLVVNRMGTDVHVQRTPAEVSVENNYKGISDLVDEVSELREQVSENSQTIEQTQSSLTSLEDEVHSGLGQKAAGLAAGGIGAGTIALGRAGMEPALQEGLSETAMNPELAAPAMAASLMAVGVGAAGAGAKGLWDRAKERFFGDEADEEEQYDSEESGGTLDSVRNMVR
ncbi:hypothetical protein C483_10621 [Natrialba hulunbeirensis JCM 10989]|uniref:eCIS core domain-containing protein n=1 Tax=Natrialba hulunbeirensis JCM 10989 TaxID=1227493 RepID=L9ZZX1_9EURY|nr:DUF4157 domain-containing protein [Natrialba hulunbeirensis]ELY91132.1 hypothetical protein C483_10621 [Natrialba hulunbeirensis JCM 10989]